MNVLVYSYFPIREHHQAGGAQQHMRDLVLAVAEQGFKLRIICPETKGDTLLHHPNVEHHAVLKEPGALPVWFDERAYNVRHIVERMTNVDLIWSIDEHFPLRVAQPIVLSFHTLAGNEELNSVFNLNWDVIIAASSYLSDTVRSLFGSFAWEGQAPTVRNISNGVDHAHFSRVDPTKMRQHLKIPYDARCILFPHRPEIGKGFEVAIKVIRELVNADSRFMLLIPTQPQSVLASVPKQQLYYETLRQMVHAFHLEVHVLFHEWITLADLPAYFSLGEWCLVLSTLAEGFCYVPVQSLSCGTPVVCNRCGSLRERFPALGHGVCFVEPGDEKSIVGAIMGGMDTEALHRGRRYVEEHYSLRKQASEYIQCLLDATKATGYLRSAPTVSGFRVSPWAYCQGDRVWHDLRMTWIELTRSETKVIETLSNGGATCATIVSQPDIFKLVSLGIVIPTYSA